MKYKNLIKSGFMKLKIDLNLSINERVSSVLAILLVMVLSVLVALITLKTANNVEKSVINSGNFDMNKKLQSLSKEVGI